MRRDHTGAIGHGGGDHVGQVVLALGVVVLQGREPALERPGGADQDAGVDLVDLQRLGVGILLLDDAADVAGGVTHHAAVAGGVGHMLRQQRELAALGGLGQALQGGGLHQWHVAVQDERGHVVDQHRDGLGHRMARAQLGGLQGPLHVGLPGKCGLDLLAAMTIHHHQPLRVEGAGGIDDMAEQGLAGQRMQYFRQVGVHPFAHAGSQDHDVHLDFWGDSGKKGREGVAWNNPAPWAWPHCAGAMLRADVRWPRHAGQQCMPKRLILP